MSRLKTRGRDDISKRSQMLSISNLLIAGNPHCEEKGRQKTEKSKPEKLLVVVYHMQTWLGLAARMFGQMSFWMFL